MSSIINLFQNHTNRMFSFAAAWTLATIGDNPPNLVEVFGTFTGLFNTFAYAFAPFVFIAVVIYAGFLRLTGGENPDQVKRANGYLFWAVIGVVMLVAALVIVNLVASIFGLNDATSFQAILK